MTAIVANTGSNNWNTNGAWVGAVQPTAADDVTIPATAVVTIPSATTALARSVTLSASGTLAFAATTSVLTIGTSTAGTGSVALSISGSATLTLTGIGTINFVSTSATQQTITSGGLTLPNVTVNGAGSSYLQSDAFTLSGTFTHTVGTYATGNFAITGVTFSSAGTGTRTLTLGSSAISLSGNWNLRFSGLTMSTNTATVTQTGATSLFDTSANCGGDYKGMSLVQSGSGLSSYGVSAAITLGTYTRTGTAVKTDGITAGSDLTLTSLTGNGNTATNRMIWASSVRGTARTVTVTNAPTLTNLDFMDITTAGAGGTWSGTSLGNALGNTGITFTTAAGTSNGAGGVNRYLVAAGNTSATATWATTSGGAGGASVPLPQDSIIGDSSSGAGTYTNDMPRLAAGVNFTGFTRTWANGGVNYETYGGWTWGSGMTVSGNPALSFAGRGSHTITSNTKTFVPAVTFNGPGSTYTLGDNFTDSATGGITVTSGTLVDAGFTVTISSGAAGFTLNGGTLTKTGTWNFSRTNTGTFWQYTSGTISDTGGAIVLTAATANSRTLAMGNQSYNGLTCTVAGSTGSVDITGSPTITTVLFSDATNARSLRATAGQTITVVNFNGVVGTASKLMTLTSVTGAAWTLSKASGTVSCDFLSIDHCTATGGATFYAGSNSTDGGSNSGWIFTQPPILVSITDVIGITDSAAPAAGFAVSQTDAIGVTDTATAAADLGFTVVDLIGVTDGASAAAGLGVSVVDPVGVLDSTSVAAGYNPTIVDVIGIVDSSATAAGYNVSVIDLVGVTDVASPAAGYAVVLVDPIGITDTFTLANVLIVAIVDAIGVTDSAAAVANLAVAIVDPVGISDSRVTVASLAVALTDLIGLSDSMAATAAYTVAIVDPVGLTDATTAALGISITIVDPVGVSDSISPAASISIVVTDPIGVLDTATATLIAGNILIAVVDAVGITDSIVVTVTSPLSDDVILSLNAFLDDAALDARIDDRSMTSTEDPWLLEAQE